MKQLDMKNETKTQGNIQDVFPKNKSIYSAGKPANTTTLVTPLWVEQDHNIFMIQNKGKGPPGRQRSPGVGSGLFPDHPPDGESDQDASPLSFGREGPGVSQNRIQFIHTKQTFYNTHKLNFYLQLNFTNMKKQILILAFFVLAVLANVNVAWGQATHFSPATAVTCATDALNPIAGREYNYSAVIAPAGGTARWHVVAGTTTTTFIANGAWAPTDQVVGGDYLLSANPATFNPMTGAAASPSTLSLTWKSTGLAEVITDANRRLFLGLEYTGPTCNDNLQVWEIKPKNAFTIDVYNTDGTNVLGATGSTASTCYSEIAGALYNAGNVTMNYGTNTITYEVVAANFTGSFSSTVRVSGLQTGQTADVSWGYTIATAGTTSIGSGSNGSYGPIAATIAAGTDTGLGVSVFVRVVVHNNGYEGLTNDGIVLAADATDSAGQDDVKVSDCAAETAFADQVTHTLTQRPTVNGAIPATFLPKN